MRAFLVAATGLPTLLLTAALVVVVCFWLLVAVGVTAVDSFDTDVDLRLWGMGGVPVAVAISLQTALAWSLSVGVTVVLATFVPTGATTGLLLSLVAPVGALLVAWRLTCLFVRPLHRLFPDEPGLSQLDEARPGAGAGAGAALRGADGESQEPRWRASYGASLHPQDRTDRAA